MIQKNHLIEFIEIIILNNASKDSTVQYIEKIIEDTTDAGVHLYNQMENVGMLKNFTDILLLSNRRHVLFLGDDDYINCNYLCSVIELIQKNNNITCIIPSYQNILPTGEITGVGRDIGKHNKELSPCFMSVLKNSWKGHQLSGLVFDRQLITNYYNKYKIDNLYPFILFTLAGLANGKSVLLLSEPVMVTRPGQKNKAWGYGEDGLINHVFENYKVYIDYSYYKRCLLQLHFLYVQYWRYAMYLKVGIPNFIKAVLKITTAKNALVITRICTPIVIPIFLLLKSIELFLSGNLLKVLKTEVEK